MIVLLLGTYNTWYLCAIQISSNSKKNRVKIEELKYVLYIVGDMKLKILEKIGAWDLGLLIFECQM
jgi:hypothetical protein